MTHAFRRITKPLIFFGCLLAGMPGRVSAAEAGSVWVGASYQTFVVPEKTPLAGYSRRHGKPMQGQHDPVGVRALVFKDEDTLVALVSCDLLIIDEHLFDAVRQRLIAQGISNSLVLVLAATHTHSGPGAYGERFAEKISMGHYDPAVFEALTDAIVSTVSEAHDTFKPAAMACGQASGEGLVKNRMEEGGFADTTLSVCGWYAQGQAVPFAVAVDFAAHPTTLGAWNMQLSADYPGVIAAAVERRFPGAVCLFFAGDVGDQAPVKFGGRFERAERVGGALAEKAIGFLESAKPAPINHLNAQQERMKLPRAKVRLSRHINLPGWASRHLADDDATLSVVLIGNTAWLGAPCDLASTLGRQLKQEAEKRKLQPVIIGFASDYIGYCLPEAQYRTGQYEALMAFNGPHAGELIVKRLAEMLDGLAHSTQHTAPSAAQ